jgi:hypothetical protein
MNQELSKKGWHLYLHCAVSGLVGGLAWRLVAGTKTINIPMVVGAIGAPLAMWLETRDYRENRRNNAMHRIGRKRRFPPGDGYVMREPLLREEEISMKRLLIFIITLGLIIQLTSIASAGSTTLSLKDAFDAGSVSLTFRAKDSGEKLQVEVKKVLPVSIIAKVDKGTTLFDFGTDSLSIYTDSVIMIDLTAKEEGSFIVKQSGTTRIKSGAVTWKKFPKT